MSEIPKGWKPLRGETYPVKEELKEGYGARWDRGTQLWWCPPEHFEEAQDLVDIATRYRGVRR